MTADQGFTDNPTYAELDQPQAVIYSLQAASTYLSRAHRVASESGGLNGAVRDVIFGLNTAVQALEALISAEPDKP